MSFSIAGKTAIVTGAANGVGLAIARHFLEMDANVVFADMDEEGLVREIGEEASKDDSRARYFAGDLREKLSIANLLSATIDAFDTVDILVNASRQVAYSEALCPEEDSVEELLQQNLMTSLRLTQLVAKRMIKQAEEEDKPCQGSIVNLSSIAARRTHPDLLGYSISCAALDQMTRAMAVALAPHNIRVNAVAFGSVMSASLKDTLKIKEGCRDDIIRNTPLARIASATELAEATRFLASDGSGFMTGQILTVDGGRSIVDTVSMAAH
ncbi:SDR family NAD(P)-dependent oxidoreductase [Psychromarinibacter halotolerans]|uniref:SDR family NAD(P)-dependent oxidoreductase n=1 Tax=Psychromarinibacter halotolerans TaxID=1775175 RepID=A0ABV7GR48_9RHOB|nr:SDR family oxidoreductase [Psychromarinibacter halotolerans]MAQ83788.1 oxidoreductase [Maritimibacter sp.]MDF0598881.1 SDR family oxidoreductase [Psychromarinibacter halotolerans]